MNWDSNPDKAFPARHPREPGGLRQDILDEIADHLACAAERELERGNDDEESVRRRVLEQFGDPDAIARKLWWDHMREIVMREWIQTGVMVVLALAGIAGVAFMGLMLRQFGATNEAVLAALSQQNAGEARWATIELEFRRGSEDGPPAAGVALVCNGKMFGEESTRVERMVDDSGILRIGPMQPGAYNIECREPLSGLTLLREVTTFAGATPTRTLIVTPDVTPEEVQIEFDNPVSRDADNQMLGVRLTSEWSHGNDIWQGVQECFFGPGSGRSVQESLLEPHSYSALPLSYQNEPKVVSDYVALAKHPVRISGAPANGHTAVLIRNTGGRWSADERYKISFEPLGNGAGQRYRAVLAAELKGELQDWALYDQMNAEGLTVTKELVSAIRREFPGMAVVASIPVPKSQAVGLIDRRFARREMIESVHEVLDVSYNASFLDHDTKVQRDVSWGALMEFPSIQESSSAQQRIVLSFVADDGKFREFNNPLEVWGVYGEVEPAEWPLLIFDSGIDEKQGVLKLGEVPAAVIDMAALESYPWLFADVTDAFRDEGEVPSGVLLQWRFSAEGYRNELGIVSAEAKDIKNEHRHPLWLVLEPKEVATGA